MNVSTDPRIVKQLLLSQWINNANPLEPSARNGVEDGSLFGTLLDDFMNASSPHDGLSDHALPSMAAAGVAGLPAVSMPTAGGALAHDDGFSSAYDGLISSAAARYGLDPALIKGVIQTESGFQADAVSHSGAKGLMQLMDATARGLGVTDPMDPEQNIDGGSRFLSYLLRKYDGNAGSALAAYNAGPGTVDRLGLTTDALVRERLAELPAETQRYIGKVLSAAQQWSRPA